MNVLVYIGLGVVLGVLYRWAFHASKSYKNLIDSRAPGRNGIPLFNKIVSIAIAAGALIISMVLIGADRSHSWTKLTFFLAVWLFTSLALKRIVNHIRN